MQFKKHIILTTVLYLIVNKSDGLKCYTCSITESDSDSSCADDVTALGIGGITDCDKKYCTITRIDYLDPKGKLSSMSRNCMDKVSAQGVTEDSTYRIYQRSCKTDLCNSGSGRSETGSGTVSLGDKSTIYVPGTGSSSATTAYSSAFGALNCLIIIVLLCNR